MSVLTFNGNLLSNSMAQDYDDYYGDSYYSAYPTDDKKMNAGQVHLSASL